MILIIKMISNIIGFVLLFTVTKKNMSLHEYITLLVAIALIG